jgi:microcystin-dependent protein
MPSLPANEARTVNEIPHTVFLSPECWVLLLSAFEFMDDLLNWSGAGDELTVPEIDEIQAIVAKAYEQLMDGQVGDVRWLAGACPTNMLVCDGTQYLRIDYPTLYDFLDPVFHVDSSHFVVPDLRDKVPLGKSATRAIGATGGTETETLTVAQIPAHQHRVHAHLTALTLVPVGAVPVSTPNPVTGVTGLTGGGGSHNNMQPFLVLNPCIVAL